MFEGKDLYVEQPLRMVYDKVCEWGIFRTWVRREDIGGRKCMREVKWMNSWKRWIDTKRSV